MRRLRLVPAFQQPNLLHSTYNREHNVVRTATLCPVVCYHLGSRAQVVGRLTAADPVAAT